MKILRQIGSIAFVLGLFTAIFIGVPWYLMTSTDPVIPWWLRIAFFCLMGGILLVMLTIAIEQAKIKPSKKEASPAELQGRILLQNSPKIPGREITEALGLVQGHTVFAIWLGNDLSAIMRLILGGELTEYTQMMGSARKTATDRMTAQAVEMGADAIINVRYMTTSVVGSAAELMVYGTAVKLNENAVRREDVA
ncbi:MAG: YbjQ family protein [Candidatus Eremiobacteraeota bacterium]|nr:YbjQ family protein [Candidatus Eremiobacteraeota bacterium]